MNKFKNCRLEITLETIPDFGVCGVGIIVYPSKEQFCVQQRIIHQTGIYFDIVYFMVGHFFG